MPAWTHRAMVRWSPWRSWPKGTVQSDRPYDFGTIKGLMRIQVTAYGREDEDTEALRTSPLMWRLYDVNVTDAHLIGRNIVFEEGKRATFDVKKLHTRARPGELDVVCLVQCHWEEDWILALASSVVSEVSARLCLSFGDTFRPIAPVHISRMPSYRTVSPPFGHEIRARRAFDETEIEAHLAETLKRNSTGQVDRAAFARMNIVVRRYLRAASQFDRVDEFLDLWQVCEILSIDLGPDNEAIHSRIAKGLTAYVGAGRTKGTIENALGIAKLSALRSDLVHGRRDNILGEDIKLLACIARTLLRKETQLPYEADPTLEAAMAKYTAGKLEAKRLGGRKGPSNP